MNIFKKSLDKVKPYVPGKPIEEVKRALGLGEVYKLASNEVPFPPSYIRKAINDEIKNINVKSSSESKNTFYAFTDSVYFKTVQQVWVPILIENNMMTTANKDSIEKRISIWKEKAASGRTNLIYIALGVVIFALIVLLILKGKKKKVVIVQEPPKEEK